MGTENENDVQANEGAVNENAAETSATEVPAANEGGEKTATEVGKESAAPGSTAEAGKEGEEGAAITEGGEPEYKPNFKFKAGVYNKETRALEQKEYDIDPRFHGIMKDKDTEELVRSIHAKAYGLESIKERYNETRSALQETSQENQVIKESIEGLRHVYQSAVQTGNLHKLDVFFEKLKIPQQVVMSYAIEKAKLMEMDPAQRQLVLEKINAERRAEQLAEQQANQQAEGGEYTEAQRVKQLYFEHVMDKPELSALESAFDERTGKPGAFRKAVERVGQLAWHNEGVDLTPQQAIERVIEHYSLKTNPALPPAKTTATPGAAAATVPGQKPVVARPNGKTLPNLQGRSTSPLKSKPKSIDDLKKIYNEMAKD